MEGLSQADFQNTSVLEIGSGVGHFHMSLLEAGAATATGIDLAPKMIAEAEDWSSQRGLEGRITYHQGDFMEILPIIDPADVTVMDKVVCCYPDADGLIHRSLEKTRRVYALTYPRDRRLVRLGVALAALLMRLIGSSFRPYAHSPAVIEKWITAQGFHKRYEKTTFVWLSQVYVKND